MDGGIKLCNFQTTITTKNPFDSLRFRWYIIFSGCVAETCDARSRWSSMRGFHFFYAITKEDSEMANKTFFTYDEQIEKL